MKGYDRGFADGFAAAIRQGIKMSPPGRRVTNGFSAGKDTKRLAVTLPNALFAKIRDHAVESEISMSALIVYALSDY